MQGSSHASTSLPLEPGPGTFLFTDIESSTRTGHQLGHTRWMEVLSDHHRIVGEAISTAGGHVDHTEGDAFVAVFTDAAAAVGAAITAQRRLAAHAWPVDVGTLRVRMGLHTGRVEPHRIGYLGLDAHLAARVGTAANGGQVLITAATRRAAGGAIEALDLGPHRLKDFPEPERLYHVVIDGEQAAAVPRPRSASVRPTNLPPQPRRLIGRAREREFLSSLLRQEPGSLVTLTGVGGTGKTRLAMAVGSDLLDDLPGGVFIVRLAGIRDPGSIVSMVAEVAGVTGASSVPLAQLLARRLGEDATLVILDNFEQMVAGANVIAELLEPGTNLRLLVTSQVALRLAAERRLALGPLELADAATLFAERAAAAVSGFVLHDEDSAAVEQICMRLDGMPLAIELAAARVGVLGAAELARRLDRPLGLLTQGDRDAPERQKSLRATIDWTHALLRPEAQALFARLAVCAGAVPLGTIEVLGADGTSDSTLDALDELLAFSFVRRLQDRRLGMRFLVPQALRDYAVERLLDRREEALARRSHAEDVRERAHAARLWKWGATLQQRLELLAVGDEIRPAVAWARAHDPELHVSLCAALASYWSYAGVLSEVREELTRARATSAGSPADRAWVTTLLAKAWQLAADFSSAAGLTAEAGLAWDEVSDQVERALGRNALSWVVRWDARHDDAIAMAEESLQVLRGTGSDRYALRGLIFLAHALADSGDWRRTEDVLREASVLSDGDPSWELAAIYGDCAEWRGDPDGALALFAESLSWTSTTGESHQMLMDMSAIGANLARVGRYEDALEVYELLRLEQRRTGRVGVVQAWSQSLEEAIGLARAAVPDDVARRATVRAAELPVASRAARVIALAAN